MAVFSHKWNLIFRFCTLEDFKHTHLWSPLVPLMEEIDICTRKMYATHSTWRRAVNAAATRRFWEPAAAADFVAAYTSKKYPYFGSMLGKLESDLKINIIKIGRTLKSEKFMIIFAVQSRF